MLTRLMAIAVTLAITAFVIVPLLQRAFEAVEPVSSVLGT